MSSPAQSRGLRKGTRDAIQAVVAIVAAGGATAVIDLLVGSVSPAVGVLLAFAFKILIAYLQNFLEAKGTIPVLLPTPALIPVAATADAVLAPVAGAVEAVADELGQVTGTVTDVTGGVVGKVTGAVKSIADSLHRKQDDEAGGAGLIAVFVIGFFFLVVVGGFTVCDWSFNDESEKGDKHLLGRVELASHEYDEGWEEEGGGQNYEDQWSNEDRNRNRNRNRGAFSPGPFDDSPVDAFNNVCMPGATCHYDGEPPPEEGGPQ